MKRNKQTRKNRKSKKQIRKTRNRNRNKYGGTKYNIKYLPHKITYQDITDNLDILQDIKNPKDASSYKKETVYYINTDEDPYYYTKIRVLNIDLPYGEISYIPALAKNKKYAPIYSIDNYGSVSYSRATKLRVSNINYAYEVDYSNEYYKSKISEITNRSDNAKTNLPEELVNEIYSFLERK